MSITATRGATVSPTVSSSPAYSAGDCVGGVNKFAGLFGKANTGLIQSVALLFKSVQTAEFDLYLFSGNPLNSTFTDNAAAALAAADIPLLIGRVALTANFSDLGTYTLYELDGIAKARGAGVADLYAALVTKGTPTLGSAADLAITIAAMADC